VAGDTCGADVGKSMDSDMPLSRFLLVLTVGFKRCEAFGTVSSEMRREPLLLVSSDDPWRNNLIHQVSSRQFTAAFLCIGNAFLIKQLIL